MEDTTLDNNSYNDIINMKHHQSSYYKHMSTYNRAAQFAPFAALNGYDVAIKETARLTNKKIELDEYMKESLNKKLLIISQNLHLHIEIKITYFQTDKNKSGGSYVTCYGHVIKIDKFNHTLYMSDCSIIPIDEIIKIDSNYFNI